MSETTKSKEETKDELIQRILGCIFRYTTARMKEDKDFLESCLELVYEKGRADGINSALAKINSGKELEKK